VANLIWASTGDCDERFHAEDNTPAQIIPNTSDCSFTRRWKASPQRVRIVAHLQPVLDIMATAPIGGDRPQTQIQPCRYKVGKTLRQGLNSVVKECVHIDTGRYYAAKVINKRVLAGREHMVCA
jgi:hypothetical protein